MRKLTNFCFAGLILLGLSLAMCSEQPASKTETAVCDNLEASTPQQALAKLMAGNERYVAGNCIHPHRRQQCKQRERDG